MKRTLIEEGKLAQTIDRLRGNSFTVLDFMVTFKGLFPDEWEALVERFGMFGEKRRYTVATYLANRLYAYSHKSESCLIPFRKYASAIRGDYRRATKEERKVFGSPWIAIYRKSESGL
jgi:membrane-bound lytic murein transglycosylase MltF